MTTTRDAAAKGSFYHFKPSQITRVTDENHSLFDPRVNLPVDEALVESIREHGLIEPLGVVSEGGNLLLAKGRRRHLACLEVAKHVKNFTIPCVFTKADPWVEMIVSDEFRLAKTVLEKAALAAKRVGRGESEAAVAKAFGVHPRTVKDWIALAHSPPELRKAVEQGAIPASVARDAAKSPPEAEQVALAQEAKEKGRIKGESAREKAKGRKSHKGASPSPKLSAREIRAYYEATGPNKGDEGKPEWEDTNIELIYAWLEFQLGKDPEARHLREFKIDPRKWVAK